MNFEKSSYAMEENGQLGKVGDSNSMAIFVYHFDGIRRSIYPVQCHDLSNPGKSSPATWLEIKTFAMRFTTVATS